MGEKIFGEMKIEDLNELANNLRKTKEFDEIRLLCAENEIPEETAEAFIKGDRLILIASQGTEWGLVHAAVKQDDHTEDRSEAAGRICRGMLLPLHPEPGAASTGKMQATEKDANTPPVIHTIEDVKEKLRAELNIYRDGDSKYVVEKLIELCQKDKALLEAIMLPHKTYDKAFQYFYEKSRTVGYKMPSGNMVYLDNDTAVKLSVEYFKKDDAAEAKVKNMPKPASKQEKTKWSDDKSKVQPAKPKADTKPALAAAKQTEMKQDEPKKKTAPHKEPAPKVQKPKTKDMDGQLSLFDI